MLAHLEATVSTCALYGPISVSATFYTRPMISHKMWRLIHYLAFAFVAALAEL
jgi:hypothetical protein